MLRFENCLFNVEGQNKNAKVYSLTLNGEEDVIIQNSQFSGTGYSAILNKTAGNVEIENCNFICDNYKNPIEGGQSADQGNLTVKDCVFEGIPGNNFINFYQVADGSIHTIKNCSFNGSTANNVIRLSNKNNATATFNIEDVSYRFVEGTVNEWTGFILCQDYTNRNGIKQDFSKYTINIKNLDRPVEGSLVYVYEDGKGIIEDNNPVINNIA